MVISLFCEVIIYSLAAQHKIKYYTGADCFYVNPVRKKPFQHLSSPQGQKYHFTGGLKQCWRCAERGNEGGDFLYY